MDGKCWSGPFTLLGFLKHQVSVGITERTNIMPVSLLWIVRYFHRLHARILSGEKRNLFLLILLILFNLYSSCTFLTHWECVRSCRRCEIKCQEPVSGQFFDNMLVHDIDIPWHPRLNVDVIQFVSILPGEYFGAPWLHKDLKRTVIHDNAVPSSAAESACPSCASSDWPSLS